MPFDDDKEKKRVRRARHYQRNKEKEKQSTCAWIAANREHNNEVRRRRNESRIYASNVLVRDVVAAQSRVRAAVKRVSETTPGGAARLKAARTVLKRKPGP